MTPRKTLRLVAVALLSLVLFGFFEPDDLSASANMTADPDSVYIPGEAVVIDSSFAGVALSTNADNGSVMALGSGDPGYTQFPSVFGHGAINFPGGACSGCWSFGYAVLRADFSPQAESVHVDFIDRFAGEAIVRAYGANGQLIDSESATLVGHEAAEATRLTLSVSGTLTTPIAWIEAAANTGVYGIIDRLEWKPAAESPGGQCPSNVGPRLTRLCRLTESLEDFLNDPEARREFIQSWLRRFAR